NNSNAFAILETKVAELDKELSDIALEHDAIFRAESASADYLLALLAGLVLVAALLSSFVIGRSISNPLRRLEETTKRLAAGDTAVDIPLTRLRNEIGSMSRALLVFRDQLIERRRLSEMSQADAAERLARQAKVESDIAEFRTAVTAVL